MHRQTREVVAYQCKDPGSKGVHASSPLTVGHRSLCIDDWLDHQGIDDSKEEHTGVQRPQHICEARLCRQLVSARETTLKSAL